MKKILFTFLFVLCLLNFTYTHGVKDIDKVEMESFESWNEVVDTSVKKKGKYNMMITAKDIAGNEKVVGPFNIFIDPDSDLPVTHISSPMDGARITGNVNVVGTCVDDDSVAYIELRIDGGSDVYRAKGKEFWSYYINTSNFEEGMHTVEAWGVDINGMVGKSTTTVFHLDRRLPETNVTNIGIGELVSGKITLSGTIEDGNGIERILYSLDDGQRFDEIGLKYIKKTNEYGFKFNIDTRKIEDGPKVCWFKAIDKLGSVGIYTFLFFVDNAFPEITFVHPSGSELEPIGKIFSIAGKAFDTVGLESLTWKCGSETGEFEIVPGNPYWVKEFDLSKKSPGSVVVEIIAKDIAGNVVSAKKNITIDKNVDSPVLDIISPLQDSQFISDVLIAGTINDRHGVSEIRYKIDKGEEKIIPADFSGFSTLETGVSSGKHVLSIYAVNNKGISGVPAVITFTAGGLPPEICFENGLPVLPNYNVKSKISTSIKVRSSAGLNSVSVGFDGADEIPVEIKPGITEYVIRPSVNPKSLPGIYTVSVTATDIIGRTVSQKAVIQVVDQLGTGGEENFVWAVGNSTDKGQVILLDNNALTGIYQPVDGAVIENIQVIGGSGFKAEFEGNIVKLIGTADGAFNGIGVKIIDSSGKTYTSPLLNIFSDTSLPNIKLDLPSEPSFVKNSINLKGRVDDNAGIKKVEYMIGSNSAPVSLGNSFNETLNISQYDDGPILLTIKAVDKADREIVEYRLFNKDTTAPAAEMILPIESDKVNGSILTAFKIYEKITGVKNEYKSANKDSWKEFDFNSLPSILIGTADEPISKNMQFRFTDKAGNQRVFNRYNFDIDNKDDAPKVEIHLPAENEILFKNFVISGMVFDDDAPAKLYYKFDNGSYKSIDINNSFSIPVELLSLSDNEHTITLQGEDIYGVKTEPVVRKIRVSQQIPAAEFTSPLMTETVRGIITIEGNASDKNGIKKVELSMDNGNTFSLAEGTEKWKYTVNTHVIDDGTHVVFVKATDKYDQEALFSTLVNIDNTPPVLSFEYPLTGSKLDSNLFVSGQMHDNIFIEDVSLKIKSLDGKSVPSNLAMMKLESELLVAKDIDISSLAEGLYNLEIIGIDKAKNETKVSVNFDVYRKKDKDRIELLYPLNGETIRGEFNIYGRIVSESNVQNVSLYIDGKSVETAEVSISGYVEFKANSELISSGNHKIEMRGITDKKQTIFSNIHSINYDALGPWVTIDNFAMGDFAVDRPWLKGRAGYNISEEEIERIKSKNATNEEKRLFANKKLDRVEISFDNGKTFMPTRKWKGWKYRLEDEYMSKGNHFLLVRAIMKNKEIATCRTLIKIDKDEPKITLLAPGEGGRYNTDIKITGLATDDVQLSGVTALLRKGDKNSYGTPGFIQGLHFEAAFWGASLWNIGMGLSFFDGNVKVQLHYGQFLQSQFDVLFKKQTMRYGGHILSLKLLANVLEIPFGFYFGPDWQWLYLKAGVGAQFSLFTKTQSGKEQILSALLMQVEFPRIKLRKLKYFSGYSFFTEGQLWFIPTDVNSNKEQNKKSAIKSVIPHISCGIRLDMF